MSRSKSGRVLLYAIGATILAATVGHSRAFFQAAGTGIVGYWKLDDTASPSVDSSGNNISGTWQNGPTSMSPGAPAIVFPNSPGCLSFNGTDQYIDFGNPVALPAGTSPRSMTGWAKSTTTAAGYRWIMAYGTGGTGQAMFIGMNGTTLYGGGYGDDITVNGFWDTNWHHIALTYDGTTARLYADGTERANAAKNWNLVRTLAYIGRQVNGAAEYWNGQIDDVRVYNRVLSPAEITLMSSGQSGPPAPTQLTATAGDGQVTLNWTATPGTGITYNVRRSTVNGGPYTTLVASNLNATTYVDTTVTNGVTYYYVVSAVTYGEGPYSNQATATPFKPPIVLDTTALQTIEGGAPVPFNIVFNNAIAPGQSVTLTVQTNVPTEGQVAAAAQGQPPAPAVSAQTIVFTINGPQAVGLAIPIQVYGIDDAFVDGNKPYTVTVTYSATPTGPFTGFTIPAINCTNVDNDVAGIAVSRTAGLITSESGQADTFSVTLATSPTAPLTLNFASTNTAEGTVLPPSFTFTSGNYATGVTVTVTGVDDTVLDFNVAYQITITKAAGGPAEYAAVVPPTVSVTNLDNEVPPALDHVWGGGCGLLGVEALAGLALLAAVRRRYRSGTLRRK